MVKEKFEKWKFKIDLQSCLYIAIPQGFSSTNAIANAGMRVRRNIWSLYIHLCLQTVEQQSIPALWLGATAMLQKEWNKNKKMV